MFNGMTRHDPQYNTMCRDPVTFVLKGGSSARETRRESDGEADGDGWSETSKYMCM